MKTRYTAKEYQQMIKKSSGKIELSGLSENNQSKKPSGNQYVLNIIDSLLKSKLNYSVSDSHITLIFDGARLMSVNQIFSSYETKGGRYTLFKYKKTWHEIVYAELLKITKLEIEKNKEFKMPFFDSSVSVQILRMAPRLVDSDALPTMFKFLIDALKKDDSNPSGVLAEDNPDIISSIQQFNLKGDYCVAIKIEKSNKSHQEISPKDLL